MPLLISGCAFLKKRTGEDGSKYHSAAFNDKNSAPQWMAPPKDLSKSSKLDPTQMQTQADFHFALGETYSLAGDSEKAIEEFRLTLIYDPKSAPVRTRLAKEYLRRGMLNEAIEQAEEAVRHDAKGVPQRILLGKIYANLKLYDKAIEQYRVVLETKPSHKSANLFVGAILAEKGELQKAIAHFTNLTEQKSFESKHLAYYYMGKIHQQKMDEPGLDKASRSFEKSLKQNPGFEDAVIALAKIQLHRKNKSKAIKTLSQFQKKYGPKEKVSEILVTFYMDDEKYDEALAQFEVLEANREEDLNIKMKIALIHMEKKDFKKSADYLKSILIREPKLDKVRFYLAAVYEETKNYDEAIKHFEKIPAMSQYYSESVVHTSYLYKMKGDVEKAVAAIEKGLKNRSDIVDFYTMYASLLDELKDYKKAVSMLEKATERFEGHTQLTFYLGSMYDKIGDSEQSMASMKKVLSLDENHVQALNYLAYTYAEKGIELDEAEKLVRKALELTPEDGYIMDTLGWVLYKKGEIDKAVPILEKAYELKNSESIIAEHLGDAYYKYKLPEKAKKMYMQAVKYESDTQTIQKLQNKIRSLSGERQPASEK